MQLLTTEGADTMKQETLTTEEADLCMQDIADAVHDLENCIVIRDVCKDCATGVVVHAGKNTPDHDGEPVVNGKWSSIKELEDAAHELGEEAEAVEKALEDEYLETMKLEEKKPGMERRRKLYQKPTGM